MKKYIRYWLLAVWMVCMTIIGGCSQILDTAQTSQVLYETETETITEMLAEDGVYTSKEDVALYIHLYGKLPENFITKKEARLYAGLLIFFEVLIIADKFSVAQIDMKHRTGGNIFTDYFTCKQCFNI